MFLVTGDAAPIISTARPMLWRRLMVCSRSESEPLIAGIRSGRRPVTAVHGTFRWNIMMMEQYSAPGANNMVSWRFSTARLRRRRRGVALARLDTFPLTSAEVATPPQTRKGRRR